MGKPKKIRGWALWVPRYGKWIPVSDVPNVPRIFPSRASARRHALSRHAIPKRIEIRVVSRGR